MTAALTLKSAPLAGAFSGAPLLTRLRAFAASIDPDPFTPDQVRRIYQVYRVVLPAYAVVGTISAVTSLPHDALLSATWTYQATVNFLGALALLGAPARAQRTMQAVLGLLVLGFLVRVAHAAGFQSAADFNLQSVTAPLVAGAVVTHTLFGAQAARRFNVGLALLATSVAALTVLGRPVIEPAEVLAVVRFGLCAGATALLTEFMSGLQREHAKLIAEHAAMERLALSDALTGLSNRRAAELLLGREIARSNRHGGALSVLLVDIDEFKAVNDSLGHEGGDHVLGAIAEELRGQLRATDDAARWAGDEFLVVLPATPNEGALVVAERLRAAVARRGACKAGHPVSISVGAATLVPGKDDLASLVRRADQGLYRAKKLGRNRVAVA